MIPASILKRCAVFACVLAVATATPVAARAQSTADTAATITQPVRPSALSRVSLPANTSDVPVTSLSQLLSGRFANVQVLSNGAAGTASRIRIRGQSSLLLNNDPLFIVDGVRLAGTRSVNTRSIPSSVDDINVDDIETVDIIRGPSGSAMYGNEAANTCAVDSLSRGTVMSVDSLTPIGVGYRGQYGVQVSGGSTRAQYFVSGEREDETGVFRMPGRDTRRLEAERGAPVPGNQIRPSGLFRNRLRGNVGVQPARWLSLRVASAFVVRVLSWNRART